MDPAARVSSREAVCHSLFEGIFEDYAARNPHLLDDRGERADSGGGGTRWVLSGFATHSRLMSTYGVLPLQPLTQRLFLGRLFYMGDSVEYATVTLPQFESFKTIRITFFVWLACTTFCSTYTVTVAVLRTREQGEAHKFICRASQLTLELVKHERCKERGEIGVVCRPLYISGTICCPCC